MQHIAAVVVSTRPVSAMNIVLSILPNGEI